MKKRTQFIIKEADINKRKEFLDYIKNKYDFKLVNYTEEEIINNKFPIVIDFKEKVIWVCESISCLAIAAQKGLIITIKEFLHFK